MWQAVRIWDEVPGWTFRSAACCWRDANNGEKHREAKGKLERLSIAGADKKSNAFQPRFVTFHTCMTQHAGACILSTNLNKATHEATAICHVISPRRISF
ncbi:MAG: hypothetical protein KDC61_13025, partial [Saprospiraceae bacterium]|nr:hypothetical protein [Saprospiraceae bacterium]